ncbi:hypothetical protein SAY86_000821 [Trapa natans]|uniref:Uncharacterized protein n=1 Tax=Trapa natans TaxID=22666 RepID=A0AAN7M4M6_TRANT|nr:hypothetical protein SAY86_000821 [Trapa natans]
MGVAMRSTIRCCISCILPCGSLDVVRIIHSNGYVEEISGSITAAEVLKLHPKHVLKKPSTPPAEGAEGGAGTPKIVVIPPEAELQRGKIYFLMPAPQPHQKARSRGGARKKKREPSSAPPDRRRGQDSGGEGAVLAVSNVELLVSDQYLSEILSEKISTQRERRRGRVGVWRPHLESISETPAD